MDLIDRYVRAVRLFLPKEQRDDIGRELEEDLRSQVEDRQAELGRQLRGEEAAALLRKFGHPMLMAGRYRRARNLIGPVIFPIYWQILKLVIGLFVATRLASIGLLAVRGGSWSDIRSAATGMLDNGLEIAVLITIVAAVCEWSLTRFKLLERWDPASMGRVDGPLRAAERAAHRATAQIGRTDTLVRRALDEAGPPLRVRSISEFVVLAVFACWCAAGLWFPSLIFANASALIGWAPQVVRLFPVVVVVTIVVLADQYLRLTRPDAAFVRVARIMWANAGWVLVLLLLVADHQWVVWVGTPEQWTRFGALAQFGGRTWSLVNVVNGVITATVALAALASLLGPCWRLRRFFSKRPHTAHA